MKRIFTVIVLLALVWGLLPGLARAATQSNPFVTDLIAGQHTDVGAISIWDDGHTLFVQYQTVSPWCLEETHLAVASSLADIPQENGNPIPGQFPYQNSHDCATSFLYKVPLTWSSCSLYIAAHAVINTGETAWGSGPAFPGKNWATYIVYPVEGCGAPPPPSDTPTATETSTPTSTPTDTPTATATSTPTDTPTATATNTATSTPTNTPTPTTTPPPPCQPITVTADFSQFAAGSSIEGMGVVAPNLNIDAKGTAIKIAAGVNPIVYGAPNAAPLVNGGLAPGGGFSDLITKTALAPHLYTFTFAPGMTVSDFSVHMLDFGDYNPSASANHYASITAYDAVNVQVAQQVLSYTTPAVVGPTSSDIYGDVSITGDAVTSSPGQPGNWTWHVSGTGIVKVVLEFGVGFDPNIGFDTLTFTPNCP